MKKIKITFLLALGIFLMPSLTKAQLVNIGSPIVAKQGQDGPKGVIAEKDTVWCAYSVYDSTDNKSYLRIAKYNGLFWTNYISIPAQAYFKRRHAVFYKNDLYFTGNFISIRLGATTYNDITGLFKWDGTQITLVDQFGVNQANPAYFITYDDLETFNNELYITGNFDSIGGNLHKGAAKFDGATWSDLGTIAQRKTVLLYGQLVKNDGRLLIQATNDTTVNTNKYFGLASFDGTNLTAIDSSEITIPNTARTIYSHPDSTSYYANGSIPFNTYICKNMNTPKNIPSNSNVYGTSTNYYTEKYAYNNGSVYALQTGKRWGPQNNPSPVIQKFTDDKLKLLFPPNNLYLSYWNGLGIFGKNSVYLEFTDENKNFKNDFYRLDSNETLSSTITGRAYVDLNKNCKFDVGDRPLERKWIHFKNLGKNNNTYTVTDKDGLYFIGGVPQGIDTLTTNTDINKKYTCSSMESIPLNITNDTNLVRDFIYDYDSTKKDLEIKVFSTFGFRVRRGFNDRYIVTVKNNSAFVKSGFVWVDMDSNFYDLSTTDTNVTIVGKKIKLTFTNLGPDDYLRGEFKMRLPITVPLNSYAFLRGELDSTNKAWDNCPKNNLDVKQLLVRASCDPNDKTSNPEGDILPGTTDISYHINFQNVGNDTAYRVVIVDTIDTRLPLEKISIGASSHKFSLKVVENILIFEFDNIQLVDSATNEEGSKGYIQFQAKLDPNFPLGTKVNNQAHIYFDYNEAIETNVASVLVAIPTNVQQIEQIGATLYPNPATDIINVMNDGKTKTAYVIYNTMGQEVTSGSLNSGTNQINTAAMSNGFYFIRLSNNGAVTKFQILK